MHVKSKRMNYIIYGWRLNLYTFESNDWSENSNGKACWFERVTPKLCRTVTFSEPGYRQSSLDETDWTGYAQFTNLLFSTEICE